MHHYVKRLIEELNIAEAVATKDEAVIRSALTAGDWRSLCALANSVQYATDTAWLADIASQVKAARQTPPKPTKAPDAYWSLWGSIKVAGRHEDEYRQALDDASCTLALDIVELAYEDVDKSPLRLPQRGKIVWGNEDAIEWVGHDDKRHRKEVKNDYHAVATLRKLDTDDDYWAVN